MAIDKLRERLLGLIFVPASPNAPAVPPTLEDILAGRVAGKLYDTYRQSWVASPESAYVQAGNVPLRASLEQLQAIIDAPLKTVPVKDRQIPTAESGLVDSERRLFQARGLLNTEGKITPCILTKESVGTPEALLNQKLWDDIYAVPKGDITIEHIQHSFYMAANYGYQILNGNFAAAIDDYELGLRFMNDLATYRIYVSWLWSLAHHQAVITKDGYLKAPELTEDGVAPAKNVLAVKAGTRLTPELFDKVWELHNEWTKAFFGELDRSGDPGRFDRKKAPLIMELLKRQLLSPRYIQHSARALFVIGQADRSISTQILDALFDLSREEIVLRVEAGSMDRAALAAHDYVYDVFAKIKQSRPLESARL
jgi:malate synthase